ncbi:MAG TPA: DUF2892 domain-containing protein [Gemmatimonadaceae bacterium]|nr:DUF2892 domain-containing protein [Gemmatimonadaceae bacterium]
MKRNIGDADRTARVLAGATLGFIYARLRVTGHDGPWVLPMGIITVWLLATVVLGWSPFYAMLRFSTTRPTDAGA